MEKSPFERLAAINVNEHAEKKAGLTYLSWAWAVDQLLRADASANWEYLEPVRFGETMMVRCAVTAFGKTMSCHLPVMDHRNKPIANPDAFQVNTAMQRCLVKAIALHGLGLYIYAGEDLPEGEAKPEAGPLTTPNTPTQQMVDVYASMQPDEQTWIDDLASEVERLISKEGANSAYQHMMDMLPDSLSENERHNDYKMALASRLQPKTKNALKAHGQSLRKAA